MEGKRPFVSVIMPIYNAEKYLANSIESILKQSFSDLELILVNDCSKDSSAEICKKYCEKDARVIFVNLQENIGAGEARNKGIERAEGVYLTFVDADDEIEENLYKKVVEKSENGFIDIVIWGVTERYCDKKGKVFSENTIMGRQGTWKEEKDIANEVLELEKKTILGYQCNKLYKRQILSENHIKFERTILYEDFFFTMQVIKNIHSMTVVGTAGYYYYKRFNGSITSKYVPEYFELSRYRVNEMYLYCEEKEIHEKAQYVLGNIYLRYILSALMRNENPLSKIRGKQKLKWIKKVADDPLYHNTAYRCVVNSTVLKGLRMCMNKRRFRICLLMGKVVFYTKKYQQNLFVKMTKQKHQGY